MKEGFLFLGIVVIIVLMILLILAMIKEHRNSTYVHLRTKNRYFLIEESRMKIPGEGWVDAIIYSNNKGFVFVRKKEDFYNSFKKLSEWKKEVQHK